MKTIAIIDDDIHIGDMLREVLVQEGYSVLRAYSGTVISSFTKQARFGAAGSDVAGIVWRGSSAPH